MPSKREQYFMYDCPELGVKATGDNELGPHLMRYLKVVTYAMDMPEAKRGTLLDYGCGTGYGTEMLGTLFDVSYGYDTSEDAIAYAQKMHTRSNTLFSTQRQTWTGIDFAVMADVVEHMTVEEAEDAVKWVADRMSPHGMLYISTPIAKTKDGSNPNNPYHIHEYQPGELWGMLKWHFEESCLRVVGGNITGCVRKGEGPNEMEGDSGDRL